MAGQLSAFPESIDEVLTAVQETPRGRWFLEAYAARVKNDGTSNILAAISKLENNLTAMTIGGADAGLLQNARAAIAAAKREIALLEPQTANLSAEGQLFAKLADLSRQAFAGQDNKSSVGQGVDRVLKLVSDLDQSLTGPKVEAAAAKPAVQYFKQDEAVFEAAPAPMIAAVKPVAPPVPEPSNKGAKLVIHRISQAKAEEPAPIIESVPQPVMTVTAEEEPKTPETSRIVIIRKKAEDAMEVPFLDEPQAENVNAA
jgi:hypothetical protein